MSNIGGMDTGDSERWYGQHYHSTAELSLTEIAAMIIAELAALKYDADTDTVFPERIRYAAEVDPAGNTVTVAVYGLTDAELANPDDTPSDDSPTPNDYPVIIDLVGTEYGWGSADDPANSPTNRRFHARARVLTEAEQRDEAHRIGEVTVKTA